MTSIITRRQAAIQEYLPDLLEEALTALHTRGRPSPWKRRSTADVYHRAWIDFGLFLLLQHDPGRMLPEEWANRTACRDAELVRDALSVLTANVSLVAAADIERYRAALLTIPVRSKGRRQVGLSAATINRHLAALRHLFLTAIRRGESQTDPTATVKRRKERKEKKPMLKPEQILSLIEYWPDASLVGKRNRALLAFLALTGVRREEATSLRVEDLNWTSDGLVISLLRKGGERQAILANDECAEMLQEYLEAARPQGPVFPLVSIQEDSYSTIPMSPNRVTKIVHQCSSKVLHRKVGPHALRHAFVTTALLGGAPLQEVQEYVGHSSPDTTMEYYHSSLSREHSAAEWVSLRRKGTDNGKA